MPVRAKQYFMHELICRWLAQHPNKEPSHDEKKSELSFFINIHLTYFWMQ